MPSRNLIRRRGSVSRTHLGQFAARTAPRPKIAAGLVTIGLLQLAAHFGVDLSVLGLNPPAIEALVTFAVMWLWRDPFAVPLPELPLPPAAVAHQEGVTVTFADATQAAIVRDRVAGEGGTSQTHDTVAAAAAIDAALQEVSDR